MPALIEVCGLVEQEIPAPDHSQRLAFDRIQPAPDQFQIVQLFLCQLLVLGRGGGICAFDGADGANHLLDRALGQTVKLRVQQGLQGG